MSPAPTLYGKGSQPRESDQHAFGVLLGGALCLDFINTIDDHSGATAGVDEFAPGYINVVEWFVHAGVVPAGVVPRLLAGAGKEPREAAAVRKRASALRAALFEIVVALTSAREPAPEAIDAFNGELHHALASGRFEAGGPVLQWQWVQGKALDHPLWPVCRSAASLLSSDRVARVWQCAAPGCQRFFLDTSRNGSRRYCSATTCGTAERVRRYRERHSPGS